MKRIDFVGSVLKELKKFPKEIKENAGYALYLAQRGERGTHTKILKGFGNASIIEIKEDGNDKTYRIIYTTHFKEAIYVLHAFEKKSKKGIQTPQKDMDVVKSRFQRVKAEKQKEG